MEVFNKNINAHTKVKIDVDTIYLALDNLSRLTNLRLSLHFKKQEVTPQEAEIEFPMIYDDNSPFANFIQTHQPNFEEYIILLMALVPHVKVDFFDKIWDEHIPKAGEFPLIGGVRENNARTFLPTVETALFILAGADLEKRFEVQRIFSPEHWLFQKHILHLETVKLGDPISSARFSLHAEFVELFTIGAVSKPAMSLTFPAQQVTTLLDWSDLVLPTAIFAQIDELKNWVRHEKMMMEDWGMSRKFKPGYRALFYGAPGTGKTLTASLLGKYTGLDVFKVDLSLVVSKYIGETEKNLSRLFDKAHNKNWILFFDEADALFGKRTEVKDAHDRYANQEVSFLLQKVENYPGLVILSSNFKNNIDDAFSRRFNSIIHFSKPGPKERLQLWQKAFPEKVKLADDIAFESLAERYELTGANIMNVVQSACLSMLAQNESHVSLPMIQKGIQKEFQKEGKV